MSTQGVILVDGHVHGHRCFALPDVLEQARRNFAHARQRLGVPGTPGDALLLAESRREDFFARCRAVAAAGSTGQPAGWQIEPTGEEISLRATHDGGAELLIVSGRQIATRERLELLVPGERDAPEDGLPFASCLEKLDAPGAIVIVPWGFGKWTGRRGELVDAALARGSRAASLFLGDNGGRSGLTARPARIVDAEAHRVAGDPGGAFDLPGSDPLPFPSHVRRVGSRGFVVRGTLDGPQPAARLLRSLASLDAPPRQFGPARPFPAFVADQLRMQWRLRRPWGRRP